ncbi:nitroreductase/quinone reductase family protein [Streptomyces bacillaris]
MGLGPVLGRHRLLLHHTDRSSGRIRHTALKVIAYDAKRSYWLLASAPEAAWYRDLHALPLTTIQVHNRHYAVTAHLLDDDEAERIMTGRSHRIPRVGRRRVLTTGTTGDDVAPTHRWAGSSLTLVRLDAAPGQRPP